MSEQGKIQADEHGRIVLKEAHEVAYWTDHLGVTEDQLRSAVAAAGDSAAAVRRHLGTQAHAPAGRSDQPTTAGAVPSEASPPLNPGDEAAPGTPGTGETVCPGCGGSGRQDGRDCPVCGGTGEVTVGIGGA